MKKKKMISVNSFDETGGRLLLDAPGIVDGTGVSVFLDGKPESWGVGIVQNEQAFIIGSPLGATYSLDFTMQPANPKLLPAE